MKRLTVQMPDDTHAALKAVAARRRLGGPEAAALSAIEAWLDRGGSDEAEQCRALIASVEDGQRAICSFLSSVWQAGE